MLVVVRRGSFVVVLRPGRGGEGWRSGEVDGVNTGCRRGTQYMLCLDARGRCKGNSGHL